MTVDDAENFQGDSKGNLWVLFNGEKKKGIWSFDGKKWQQLSLPDRIETSICFVVATNGDIWLCGGRILYRLNNLTQTWEKYPLEPGIIVSSTKHFMRNLRTLPDGSLILVGEMSGFLAKFDGKDWTLYSVDLLERVKDGEITPLKSIQTKAEDASFITNEPLTTNLYSLVFDRTGNLWAGYSGGVVQYNNLNWKYYTFSTLHPVTQIVVDQKDRVWAVTFDDIFLLEDDKWTAMGIHKAWRITFSSDGYMWVGTNHGISVYSANGNLETTYTEKEGLPSNFVEYILAAPDKKIWAGTDKGVSYFDGIKWNFSLPISNSGIDAMLVTSKNIIWVETSYEGIKYFDGIDWNVSPYLEPHYLLSESESNDEGVWAVFGSNNPWNSSSVDIYSLCKLTVEIKKCYPLGSNNIAALAVAPTGVIWITPRLYTEIEEYKDVQWLEIIEP